MVGVRGFEPPTLGSQNRCANRTALHPERRTHTTNNFLKIKFFVWFWNLGSFKLLRSLDFWRAASLAVITIYRDIEISILRRRGKQKTEICGFNLNAPKVLRVLKVLKDLRDPEHPKFPRPYSLHFLRRFYSEQVKPGFDGSCNRFGEKKA